MDPTDYKTTLGEIEKISNGTRLVKEFLDMYPHDFMDTLSSWIQFGEKRCDLCMLMLYMLRYEQKTYLLGMATDQSVLHLAATFHNCQRLVSTILEMQAPLAYGVRSGQHAGLTPLHIIVSKGDIDTTQAYLKGLRARDQKKALLCLATGSRFKGTVLMGETALSAAVLEYIPKGVLTDSSDLLVLAKVLMHAGAALHDRNSMGETVIHTLVRYAHLYPERRAQVLDMLAELQHHLLTPDEDDTLPWGRRYARSVWFCQNNDRRTALQLAATLGEHEIVCFIMELQWIYRTLHDYDGIFETNKYDITEIDTLAKISWCRDQEKNFSQLVSERVSRWTKFHRLLLCYDAVVARRSTPAILEVILEVDVEAACNIISTPVVNKLISAKWYSIRSWFYCWAVLYIFTLFFLSAYASFKFRYVHYLSRTGSDDPTRYTGSLHSNSSEGHTHRLRFVPDELEQVTEGQKIFVNIGCAVALLVSFFSLYVEAVRSFVQRKPWNLLLVHHNGHYRLLLLMNALALGVDSFWFILSPSTNSKTPMILALLSGWWFTTFFLRPFKKFSFFTVMLLKVLLGDMMRFFTIIVIALLSFTIAMHLLFMHGESLPKEFENLPRACLTMFKLMLGLSDLEILEHANPAWLAVTLFVIYVLLTYVLLINSLIAMMSNTCSEIAGQKSNQWRIQRLSVILFLENMILSGLVRPSGTKNYFRKSDDGVEARYVIQDIKLSDSHQGDHLGHDIQQKAMFVASQPRVRRSLSSAQDLWSFSDDNFSYNSISSAASMSNVSLAESFVMKINRKFHQASRKRKACSQVFLRDEPDSPLIKSSSSQNDIQDMWKQPSYQKRLNSSLPQFVLPSSTPTELSVSSSSSTSTELETSPQLVTSTVQYRPLPTAGGPSSSTSSLASTSSMDQPRNSPRFDTSQTDPPKPQEATLGRMSLGTEEPCGESSTISDSLTTDNKHCVESSTISDSMTTDNKHCVESSTISDSLTTDNKHCVESSTISDSLTTDNKHCVESSTISDSLTTDNKHCVESSTISDSMTTDNKHCVESSTISDSLTTDNKPSVRADDNHSISYSRRESSDAAANPQREDIEVNNYIEPKKCEDQIVASLDKRSPLSSSMHSFKYIDEVSVEMPLNVYREELIVKPASVVLSSANGTGEAVALQPTSEHGSSQQSLTVALQPTSEHGSSQQSLATERARERGPTPPCSSGAAAIIVDEIGSNNDKNNDDDDEDDNQNNNDNNSSIKNRNCLIKQTKTEEAEDEESLQRPLLKPRLEKDPKWLALLKSIESLNSDKRRASKPSRRPSHNSSKAADVRQKRDAFIRGLGPSYDKFNLNWEEWEG